MPMYSRRWHTDSPLTTLPHVSAEHLSMFQLKGRAIHALPELVHHVGADYSRLEQVGQADMKER